MAMLPKRDTQSSDFARVLRESAPYLGLGTALATTVGLFFAFGYWLDSVMGTESAWSLAFGLLGVIVALVQFVRMASNLNKSKKTSPPADTNKP